MSVFFSIKFDWFKKLGTKYEANLRIKPNYFDLVESVFKFSSIRFDLILYDSVHEFNNCLLY